MRSYLRTAGNDLPFLILSSDVMITIAMDIRVSGVLVIGDQTLEGLKASLSVTGNGPWPPMFQIKSALA